MQRIAVNKMVDMAANCPIQHYKLRIPNPDEIAYICYGTRDSDQACVASILRDLLDKEFWTTVVFRDNDHDRVLPPDLVARHKRAVGLVLISKDLASNPWGLGCVKALTRLDMPIIPVVSQESSTCFEEALEVWDSMGYHYTPKELALAEQAAMGVDELQLTEVCRRLKKLLAHRFTPEGSSRGMHAELNRILARMQSEFQKRLNGSSSWWSVPDEVEDGDRPGDQRVESTWMPPKIAQGGPLVPRTLYY